MTKRIVTALTMAGVLGACGTRAPATVDAEATESTVRVSLDEIADVAETLPENVAGIDLGEIAPSGDATFCEAFAAAPARWVDDAVVPVQFWVDAFTSGRDTAPAGVVDSVDRLLAYGQWKLDWNFKRVEERPTWTSADAEAAVAIADAAVDECGELPLVVGIQGRNPVPFGWDDLTDEQRDVRCSDDAATVEGGIDWYRDAFGEPPRHQQQIETAVGAATYRSLEETGDYPEFWFFASDLVGVGPDGAPAPVPGGACDR